MLQSSRNTELWRTLLVNLSTATHDAIAKGQVVSRLIGTSFVSASPCTRRTSGERLQEGSNVGPVYPQPPCTHAPLTVFYESRQQTVQPSHTRVRNRLQKKKPLTKLK